MPIHIRAWLYRVATAVVPLLMAYGVINDRDAAIWLALVAALLSSGTATFYTTLHDEPRKEP